MRPFVAALMAAHSLDARLRHGMELALPATDAALQPEAVIHKVLDN